MFANDYIQRTVLDPSGERREVRVRFEYITPAIAKQYLTKNVENNRNVQYKRVEALARDMANDAWWFTGDSIKFNERGRLCDGQYRLKAIIKSGRPQVLLVIYGVAEPAMLCMDKGKARSIKDSLYIEQNDSPLNSNAMISLIKAIIRSKSRTVSNVTDNDVRRIYNRYANELITVSRISPQKHFGINAQTRAALFSALINGIGQEILAEWVRVFITRNPTLRYNDEAVLKWESYVHKFEGKGVKLSQETSYYGTQNSLYFFVTGKRYQVPKEWICRYPTRDQIDSVLNNQETFFNNEEET